MTGEGVKETEPWIAEKGAKYAYAYDKGGKLMQHFGLSGLPSMVLVAADGTVLYAASGAGPSEKLIEQAVQGALTRAMPDWPESTSAVRSAMGKKKYADAMAAAAKLPEADAWVKQAVADFVAQRVARLKAARAAGDALTAIELSKELDKQLAGLPEQAEVKAVAAELDKDETAQKTAKAQKKVREMRGQKLGKTKEREKAIEDLQKIAKEHAGTAAAKEAEELLATLRKKKA